MQKVGRKKKPPRKLSGGFFSIERRVLDEDMRGDVALYAIWTTLIGWAAIADSKEKVGRQQVILKRGQILTGREELAEQWNLGQKVVRRCLTYLEETGRIGQQKGQHGTIITILKYEEYQRKREKKGQQSGQKWARNGPVMGQERATSEQENQGTTQPPDFSAGAGAGASDKKGGGGDSLQEEAKQIGRRLFMPVDRGDGKRRFVDLVALDAAMVDALAEVGIEPMRDLLAFAKGQKSLGRWVFDPNRFREQCGRASEYLRDGQNAT